MFKRALLSTAAAACGVVIAAGALPATAAQASQPARPTVVHCKGGASSCTASVSLAGGASNRRVVVDLPATGMRLVSAKPNQRQLDGAYLVTGQHMRRNGHQYAFTLSAAEAPHGSALVLRFREPSPSGAHIVRCKGNATRCQATVPIAGGASDRRVVVQLPATDMGLVSVRPSSRSLRGAYSITHQHLRKGGSEFVLVLSAVEGAPHGSHLTLTFAA